MNSSGIAANLSIGNKVTLLLVLELVRALFRGAWHHSGVIVSRLWMRVRTNILAVLWGCLLARSFCSGYASKHCVANGSVQCSAPANPAGLNYSSVCSPYVKLNHVSATSLKLPHPFSGRTCLVWVDRWPWCMTISPSRFSRRCFVQTTASSFIATIKTNLKCKSS